MKKSDKISKELKELVLYKLSTMPYYLKLSVGNKGVFTKRELEEHVKKESEIGVLFANMQLEFLKALSSGNFIKELVNENH